MSPDELDLIYWEIDGQRKMMGVTKQWHSSEVPSKGAIGPIADEIMKEFPDLFATKKDAEMFLTVRHFQNMSQHQNRAGQEYPRVIG